MCVSIVFKVMLLLVMSVCRKYEELHILRDFKFLVACMRLLQSFIPSKYLYHVEYSNRVVLNDCFGEYVHT